MVQNHPIWTEEEKAEVSRLAGQVSLPELARHLKRTEAATRVQASKLGIKLTLRRSDDRGRAPVQARADAVEKVVAPVAIERALSIYQQLAGARPIYPASGQKNSDSAYLWDG